MESPFELRPIGRVVSSLKDGSAAPRQPDEGAPEAWLEFLPMYRSGLCDLKAGDHAVLVTWLHQARRDVLTIHPRGDTSRAPQGVFSTRAPHRPNPIGLHDVTIAEIDGTRVKVRALEALDGTPIIDLKPVLTAIIRER